ncbi:DNA-binding MarR family transcriptional regulator [Saccharomonospora amisosensis]|uniref:DNA-binding MarR family transcriptional regulator n=1 Tax=Saccharomonospora amisosensis TaxID=1128677 RepID=A0A7X5ZSY4_9PSEU|nr:MarR family winged helix-turn-helix transcriptional regulator [Saccharomonospora amisosensis]NIJ13825.1 DNA-binding MarR family transcriptional regulator [Saccharomonospora amisosensis]
MTGALNDRELAAWRTTIQMHEMLRYRLQSGFQARKGLSYQDYTVLALVSKAPEGRMRPFEIAEQATWEKSRLHHQLSRMERRGLVKREQCGSRGMDVVITPLGRDEITKARPEHSADVRQYFIDVLTSEELDQYAAIARKVLSRLRDEDA